MTTGGEWATTDERSPPSPARRSHFARIMRRLWPVLVVLATAAALCLWLLWHFIVITIQPGHAGVLFRLFSGVQVERIYPPGLYTIAPWNTMRIYETRKQIVTHEMDVLTARGLTVQLSLAVRYQPEFDQLALLHQHIGPDYVRRVVLSQVESALRRELGLRTAEQVYTNDGGVLNEALVLARDEVGRNYVQADDIVIRSISLPAVVKQAIEDKLTQRELLASYTFRLETADAEANRRRLEARGQADYNRAVASTLTARYLHFEGIRATLALATAEQTSVVMVAPEPPFLSERPAPVQHPIRTGNQYPNRR